MNLVLDNVIFSLQKSGGVSSYWSEIIRRVQISESLNTIYLEDKLAKENIFRSSINIDRADIHTVRTSFMSRALPLKLTIGDRFVFHSSYYRFTDNPKATVITTVHDFIQERYSQSKLSLNSLMKRRAIVNSDKIIAISESTKRDLLNFFPSIDSSKVEVIHNGVSEDYFPIPNLDVELNQVLFVGSRANYKNFHLAVQVVERYRDFILTIVGPTLSSREISFLNRYLPNGRWRFFDNPSNHELNCLYNSSTFLLYPSSYEGFGMPIVEAMKAGCPVLALNTSSIPEVAGGAAFLSDIPSLEDFVVGVDSILNNRDYYVQLGFVNAKRFTWDKAFNQICKIYNCYL
jgi:glycosyltransferase involved in cell wall biosynthesis